MIGSVILRKFIGFFTILEFSMNIRNTVLNHISQSKSEEYICKNNSEKQ